MESTFSKSLRNIIFLLIIVVVALVGFVARKPTVDEPAASASPVASDSPQVTTTPSATARASVFHSPTPRADVLSDTDTPNASGEFVNEGGVVRQHAKVKRVVDGDTIELESGEKVRYIGIDTPETVKPNTPVQCYGEEASQKNKALVEGQEIEMEKDVSNTDRYGRLLRYVYIGTTFINQELVQEGYAYAVTFPPDVKYQDIFAAAQKDAQTNNRGLWGAHCPAR